MRARLVTRRGVIADYRYDELNRLDILTQYAPDGTPEDLSDNDKLAEFDYTVRADGKRTGVTETFWLDEDNDPLTPATPLGQRIQLAANAASLRRRRFTAEPRASEAAIAAERRPGWTIPKTLQRRRCCTA